MRYAEGVARRIAAVAAVADAPVKALDADWFYEVRGDRLHYRDARGAFDTPLPGLPGPHQPGNLALAIAMMRHQTKLVISTTAIETAARGANWPARMQRLTDRSEARRVGQRRVRTCRSRRSTTHVKKQTHKVTPHKT